MGRYGLHVEQTYRNAFGLKKSKCIDWLKLNVSLAKRFLGKQGRWAIAIDPSYISKAGKKTPHIGRFWSGCAQSVKHGLEIMGIGLIDIDTKDCMMLRAHQSLNNKELSLRNKTMVDFYISVIKRYRKELLKLSTLIVADAYFSTSTFVNGIKKEGFSLVCLQRQDFRPSLRQAADGLQSSPEPLFRSQRYGDRHAILHLIKYVCRYRREASRQAPSLALSFGRKYYQPCLPEPPEPSEVSGGKHGYGQKRRLQHRAQLLHQSSGSDRTVIPPF